MAEPDAKKGGDELIMRCPFCKARVQNIDSECPICGEALTAQNVLRVKSSVKIFSRPLLAQADEAASEPRPTPSATEPVVVAPATPPTMPPAPPISKPRTEPLKPPRPLTQPNPRVSVKNSRQPSGYTVGLLVGFAVIVLGAAILVGVNLARQATTEAKATEDQKREQAAKITVVYKEAEPTQTLPAPTVMLQPTVATEATPKATLITSFVVFTATSSSVIAAQPTVVAPTPTPTLKPTLEIIPIFSPTPTQKPTSAPTATKRPATATPTQLPSATPAPTQTSQPSATFTPAPTQTAAPTKVVAKWELALVSARYETSGRPTQACSNFDASDVVRKFTFTLHITQTTGRDLSANDWGVAAFVGAARVQQVCYFKTEGPTPPALPNGTARQITLSAFVGQGQSITALVVGDTTGSSDKLCVKDTQAVACL
jgi:hypothetical protein